ncbi:hypothetical protein [Streptomyces sp. NPDC050504]|uniref:hypothetical protein n=1 Tax=Streptomyces sp. NPDC050504 TaxID=3365618 RepID=UPI0037B48F88
MSGTKSRTNPRTTRNVVLAAAGALVALAFAAVVAVPAVKDWYDSRHDEFAAYATGAKAKEDRASVPRWLPDDAKDVEYGMKTTGGDRLLKATLPAAGLQALPPTCKPHQQATALPKPGVEAPWFPKNTTSKASMRCDLYYAYTDGSTLYAWQYDADWIDANKAASGH